MTPGPVPIADRAGSRWLAPAGLAIALSASSRRASDAATRTDPGPLRLAESDVLGVLEPDAGKVRWRGRPMNHEMRQRIGHLPEDHGQTFLQPVRGR